MNKPELGTTMHRPRILLADDHRAILERASGLLNVLFDVVAIAANGEDLIREAKLLNPDVIVADITMPIVSGIEAAHELREAGSSAKFIFLTVHQQTEFLDACWSEGALGYVVKSRMYTDLIPAIEKVLAGEQFVSPVVFQ
ncbi:MAG: response regulator transcription factor [Candidatus Korobacteraceae bacterium]